MKKIIIVSIFLLSSVMATTEPIDGVVLYEQGALMNELGLRNRTHKSFDRYYFDESYSAQADKGASGEVLNSYNRCSPGSSNSNERSWDESAHKKADLQSKAKRALASADLHYKTAFERNPRLRKKFHDSINNIVNDSDCYSPRNRCKKKITATFRAFLIGPSQPSNGYLSIDLFPEDKRFGIPGAKIKEFREFDELLYSKNLNFKNDDFEKKLTDSFNQYFTNSKQSPAESDQAWNLKNLKAKHDCAQNDGKKCIWLKRYPGKTGAAVKKMRADFEYAYKSSLLDFQNKKENGGLTYKRAANKFIGNGGTLNKVAKAQHHKAWAFIGEMEKIFGCRVPTHPKFMGSPLINVFNLNTDSDCTVAGEEMELPMPGIVNRSGGKIESCNDPKFIFFLEEAEKSIEKLELDGMKVTSVKVMAMASRSTGSGVSSSVTDTTNVQWAKTRYDKIKDCDVSLGGKKAGINYNRNSPSGPSMNRGDKNLKDKTITKSNYQQVFKEYEDRFQQWHGSGQIDTAQDLLYSNGEPKYPNVLEAKFGPYQGYKVFVKVVGKDKKVKCSELADKINGNPVDGLEEPMASSAKQNSEQK